MKKAHFVAALDVLLVEVVHVHTMLRQKLLVVVDLALLVRLSALVVAEVRRGRLDRLDLVVLERALRPAARWQFVENESDTYRSAAEPPVRLSSRSASRSNLRLRFSSRFLALSSLRAALRALRIAFTSSSERYSFNTFTVYLKTHLPSTAAPHSQPRPAFSPAPLPPPIHHYCSAHRAVSARSPLRTVSSARDRYRRVTSALYTPPHDRHVLSGHKSVERRIFEVKRTSNYTFAPLKLSTAKTVDLWSS